jgi:SNF2 family DNA or RNA helicase
VLSVEGSAAFNAEELSFRRLLIAAITGHRFIKLRGRDHVELEGELIERLRQAQFSMQLTQGELRIILAGAKTVVDAFDRQVVASDERTAAWLDLLKQPLPDPSVLDSGVLSSTLRPYQRDGVRWLLQCSGWATGACLADEMGLGKTIQAIAVLLQHAAAGPALVVAPTSVLPNWQAELSRFAPSLNAIVYRGAKRRQHLSELDAGTVLVASYDIVLRDRVALTATAFATQVIDEAQMIRNVRSERARALKAIPGSFQIALTGTPIENRLGDLWSLFDLIAPGLLGSWSSFRALVGVPLEREQNGKRAARLRAVISPLLLRRTKAEVAAELPARVEVVRRIALSSSSSPKQRSRSACSSSKSTNAGWQMSC